MSQKGYCLSASNVNWSGNLENGIWAVRRQRSAGETIFNTIREAVAHVVLNEIILNFSFKCLYTNGILHCRKKTGVSKWKCAELSLEVLLVFTGKSRGDAGASLSETHSISVSGSLQSKCLRRINDTRTITDFVESCDSCEIKYENLISALLNLSSLP